jgi:hypothetical protein
MGASAPSAAPAKLARYSDWRRGPDLRRFCYYLLCCFVFN